MFVYICTAAATDHVIDRGAGVTRAAEADHHGDDDEVVHDLTPILPSIGLRVGTTPVPPDGTDPILVPGHPDVGLCLGHPDVGQFQGHRSIIQGLILVIGLVPIPRVGILVPVLTPPSGPGLLAIIHAAIVRSLSLLRLLLDDLQLPHVPDLLLGLGLLLAVKTLLPVLL